MSRVSPRSLSLYHQVLHDITEYWLHFEYHESLDSVGTLGNNCCTSIMQGVEQLNAVNIN